MTISLFELLTLIGLPSLVTGLLSYIINKYVTHSKYMRLGMQALLRHSLLESHAKYSKRGYVSEMEKKDYEGMYVSYHNLGKNGIMDAYYQEVVDLPTEKPNRKKEK